jgi:IrrE N-terminal-like domain
MASWSSHLERRTENAIEIYLKLQEEAALAALPVDLRMVAHGLGSIDIEDREMIPEAAVQLTGSRFRIYLRSNFDDRPGTRIRRRFSLAHEIAHTFFFVVSDKGVKPMREGPHGINLESACHEGASRLLIPELFLRKHFREKRNEIACEDVLRLAETFDVSLEVVLRRLRNEQVLESAHVCFALCRHGKIEYAMYPAWLTTVLAKPAKMSVQSWFRTSTVSLPGWFSASGLAVDQVLGGSYIGHSEAGTLTARRLPVGSSQEVFEIRRHPGDISIEALRSQLFGSAVEVTRLARPDIAFPKLVQTNDGR